MFASFPALARNCSRAVTVLAYFPSHSVLDGAANCIALLNLFGGRATSRGLGHSVPRAEYTLLFKIRATELAVLSRSTTGTT